MKKVIAFMLSLTIILLSLSVFVYAADVNAGGTWTAKDIVESKNGVTSDKASKLSEDQSYIDLNENTQVFGYTANFTAGTWFFEIEITPDIGDTIEHDIANFYCDFGDGSGNEGNGVLGADREQFEKDLKDGEKQTVKVTVNIPADGSYKFGYWSSGKVPFKVHSFKVYKENEEQEETEEPKTQDPKTEEPKTEGPKTQTPAKTGDAVLALPILLASAAAVGGIKLKNKK